MRLQYGISGFVVVLVIATSCMADFDRHRVDFTEGPMVFRLEAEGFDVPPDLLVGGPGSCEVASIDCTDPLCPGMVCSEGGACVLQSEATLSRDVNMDYAYEEEMLRVESVSLEQLSASLMASSLNLAVEEVRILWAPFSATRHDARELAVAGPVDPDQGAGSLVPALSDEGLSALESHLVDYSRFRVFLEFSTVIVPGTPCPEGELMVELSLRFLLTGEPRI